jgi:hypothetical protein
MVWVERACMHWTIWIHFFVCACLPVNQSLARSLALTHSLRICLLVISCAFGIHTYHPLICITRSCTPHHSHYMYIYISFVPLPFLFLSFCPFLWLFLIRVCLPCTLVHGSDDFFLAIWGMDDLSVFHSRFESTRSPVRTHHSNTKFPQSNL